MTGDTVDTGTGHGFTWIVGDIESFDDVWPPLQAEHGKEAFPDALCYDQDEETGRKLVLVGIIESHHKPDGSACAGAVNFARPRRPSEVEAQRPVWVVHSLSPLHIEPSVLCVPEKGGCGSHGYIREGRWVEA